MHNDADDADNIDDADDADDYIRVIGIAQLKAFSCAKKGGCPVVGIELYFQIPFQPDTIVLKPAILTSIHTAGSPTVLAQISKRIHILFE